ncbi:hypothetical protein [uncultured Ruminococcus sp.]|uniref:hypothetical protein n=1 Tax=uncultured Ruminococcus sp. TaxID=165186 RepID=UPI0025D6C69F|nr:hypothetical protein [uncultured Ruminococcus sp.]
MEYSDSRFGKMQEDAVRRVMEMQQRSRNAAQQDIPEPRKPADNTLAGLFGGMDIDEEKILIALLIYILYKQGADIKLLVGLAYLLI